MTEKGEKWEKFSERMATVGNPPSGLLATTWYPPGGRGKPCRCPPHTHEKLTAEEREYWQLVQSWLAQTWAPNPSYRLVNRAVGAAIGASLAALDRIDGGFEHHAVPALRAWLKERGGP